MAMLTDRVVAVSDAVAEQMVESDGIGRKSEVGSRKSAVRDRKMITVIPNGIAPIGEPEEEEVALMRSELGIPSNAVVVGTVGRLAHVKGHDRFLTAFAACRLPTSRLRRGFVGQADLQLLLIGDGPARGALEEQARELGIGKRVVFAGYREDARRLIAAMDLFVLPSRSEGLPVALLEAMDAGVPVMATDVGESRAVIEDGECGVVLPDDEGAWPELIVECLAEAGGRKSAVGGRQSEVGGQIERARRRVRECYSLSAALDAYERIYEEVGGQRSEVGDQREE